jgi:SAM-dependent methyltransferase
MESARFLASRIFRVTLYYPKRFMSLFFISKHYEITPAYFHRKHPAYYDDSYCKDEWQKEVYEYALNFAGKHQLKSVLDYGCGSGYKLLKNFKGYNCAGVEIEPMLTWLKKTYPENTWYCPNEVTDKAGTFELLICADVIEHFINPDELIAKLKQLHSKYMVISTPDRNLFNDKYNELGPPNNPCHCREWNYQEFECYVRRHFEVLDHCCTNRKQTTQLILCR